MVKQKVEGETKEEKFKRIASARTQRILEDLRLIGNCANTGTYQYSKEDINKIFSTIEKEVKRVKSLFDKPKVEFSLRWGNKMTTSKSEKTDEDFIRSINEDRRDYLSLDRDRLILVVIDFLQSKNIESTFDKIVVTAFKLFPKK